MAEPQKKGAHHPKRDPYQQPGVEVEYSKDMCPNTLDILGRTVGIGTIPTRSPAETEELAATIKKAAGSI